MTTTDESNSAGQGGVPHVGSGGDVLYGSRSVGRGPEAKHQQVTARPLTGLLA